MKELVYQSKLDSDEVIVRLKKITTRHDSLKSLMAKKSFHGTIQNDKFEMYTFNGGGYLRGHITQTENHTIINVALTMRKSWKVVHRIILFALAIGSIITLTGLINERFQDFEFGHILIPFILVFIYYIPKIAVQQHANHLSSVFMNSLETTRIDTKPNKT